MVRLDKINRMTKLILDYSWKTKMGGALGGGGMKFKCLIGKYIKVMYFVV